MAASRQVWAPQDPATCSVCLNYFKDPVSLDCGHRFCRLCISPYWEGAGAAPPCPQCRPQGKNPRPKRELGPIVDLSDPNISPPLGPQKECPKHIMRLQLFCAEDHNLLCMLCRDSRKHISHTVFSIEDAAEGYRRTLRRHLEQLETKLQELAQRRAKGRRKASEVEENFESEIERVHIICENLKEYLEREKQLLLSGLEQELKESLKKNQGALTHLEEQLTICRDLVVAIEKKCGQPGVDLLMDVQDILTRCDSVKGLNCKGESEKDQNTQSLRQQDPLHEKIMEIKEGFLAELEWSYAKSWEREVTLDQTTANADLIVSEDGRSVRDVGKEQDLNDKVKAFNCKVFVLSKQRLRSGKHYWEVEVGESANWDLGICEESVSGKGDLSLKTENRYWFVFLQRGEYYANVSCILLTPLVRPRVVGLFLDCEAGRLLVYNVQDRSLLFTFSEVSFRRTLRPFFRPESSKGGKPGAALRVLSGIV